MMQNRWRNDFPILNTEIYGHPLVYLDNAASMQLPQQVIRRIAEYYENEHANVHRGIHYLSETATASMEEARKRIAAFIRAKTPEQIVFTQGTTDSIHLVSAGIECGLRKRDAVIVTELEHHSNYVPWQQICDRSGAEFLVCPAKDGELDRQWMHKALESHHVRIAAVTQVSNLTGTVTPLREIIDLAHRYGTEVLVDGAQGILHQGIDVSETDPDYYVFSGHKMLGPTGIGVLYGKRELLERIIPVRFGGGMVDRVQEEKTTWDPLPYRLEAGTPNISGIVGLGEAVQYLENHDVANMRIHEKDLLDHLITKLSAEEKIRFLGHPDQRAAVLSLAIEGIHPYDLACLLDKKGIAVRSGNLCAQPGLRSLGEDNAIRVSVAFYNTMEEIDFFYETLIQAADILS